MVPHMYYLIVNGLNVRGPYMSSIELINSICSELIEDSEEEYKEFVMLVNVNTNYN